MSEILGSVKNELSEDELALRDFLMDIRCLDALSPWTSRFNLFNILKIARTEIRHSNMLAWLIDPNEGHGLGDSVLRGIIHYAIENTNHLGLDVFKTLLMDFHNFVILREWRNIDILAVSRQERFVVCIENKISSDEHDDQLERYREIVKSEYQGYQVVFLFLTPDGYDSSDSEHWQTIGYQNILDIIVAAKERTELLPDVSLLIENYVETVRRDIVGDERLLQICNEIYAKHRRALDLIYENRPDAASKIKDIIVAWCLDRKARGLIDFDPEKSSKGLIRFTTKRMTEILPESNATVSGWKSTSFYYYEIVNRGDKIKVMLTLGSIGMGEEQKAISDRLISILKPKQKKDNWSWKRIRVWNWQEIREDDTQEAIWKYMDQYLKSITKFEEELRKQWEET